MIGRIVAELEGFKNIDHNHAIIPSLRLFAIGKTEYIDLMSRNTGDVVSCMHSAHLINTRSFEVFEEKIDGRFKAVENETNSVEAIAMEITVERKSRLNRFYWITCSPDETNNVTLGSICSRLNYLRLSKPLQQNLDPNNTDSIAITLDNISCRLLVTLNVKPEEVDHNSQALEFMTCGGYFTNHGTAPSNEGSIAHEDNIRATKSQETNPRPKDRKVAYTTKQSEMRARDTVHHRDPEYQTKETYRTVRVKERYTTGEPDSLHYDTLPLHYNKGSSPSLDVARARSRMNAASSYEELSPSNSRIGTHHHNPFNRMVSRGSVEVFRDSFGPLMDNSAE
jgi:hypothetical protein